MVPATGVSRPLTVTCFGPFLPKASKSDCARGARGLCFRLEANEAVKTIDERLNLHQSSEIKSKWAPGTNIAEFLISQYFVLRPGEASGGREKLLEIMHAEPTCFMCLLQDL